MDRGKDDGTWWVPMNNKREFHINVSACGSYFFKALYSMCAIIMIHELANVIHDNASVISPSK